MTIQSLRLVNSYELSKHLSSGSATLDAMIIQHLDTVRELKELDAHEELIARMMVEGYTITEIAGELELSTKSVRRFIKQVRWTLLATDPRECRYAA